MVDAQSSSTGGRAGRRHRVPNPFGASPPFRRGCHPPPEREQESRPGRESRRRATPERTETGRAAPNEGRNTTEIADRRGAFLATTDPRSGLRPRTGGGTPRAIARIEVRAIGSAYVVGKVLLSPQAAEDPGAGAGGVATIKVAGARAGELAARSTVGRWRRPGRARRDALRPWPPAKTLASAGCEVGCGV